MSEEALLEGIRLYVAREVGHCLGLADNASASAAFSVESLRSPEFTRQNGIASSVMDELPYNYIAQPQDGKADFIQNKLGAYDLFAIQMGYMLVPDAKTPEEIREKIMRWVSMKSGDPVYRYGKRNIRVQNTIRVRSEVIWATMLLKRENMESVI